MSTRVCRGVFGLLSISSMYCFFYTAISPAIISSFYTSPISLLSYLVLVPLISVVEAEYKPGYVCFAGPVPPAGGALRVAKTVFSPD